MDWTWPLIVLMSIQASYSQTNVSIMTSKGPIIGLRWDPNPDSLSSYDAFLGIPYGHIPSRFQPAVLRSNWITPLITQKDGPACPQPSMPFSEDCLYLNVFTPVNASLTPGKFPVMAFIHGSGFTIGSSSSLFYGPDFIVPQGVILVAMNYRLGAAGFLTLGSPMAPGNLGILDIQLALRWIQQEISVFGGNPGQVTLAGHSAGSVITMFHYLSSESSGMFQRAIAQSGSALSTWGHVEAPEAVRRAKLLATAVGCDTTLNNSQILTCLQQQDINTIVKYQSITLSVEDVASGNAMTFVPVLDTDFGKPPFFTDILENLLKQAINRSKPLITGFTSEEGTLFFYPEFDSYKVAESNLEVFIPRSVPFNLSDGQKLALGKKIKSKYFPETVVQNKVLDIVNLYTDYSFAYPTIDVIKQLSNTQLPVYGYVFAYDGSWAPMLPFFTPYQVTGVCHGADMFYLFYYGQDLDLCRSNLPNLAVRDILVRWWTNFIKDGVPDPTGLWSPAASGCYLLIDSTVSTVNCSMVEENHYNFWANLNASDLINSALSTATIDLFILISTSCFILLNFNI